MSHGRPIRLATLGDLAARGYGVNATALRYLTVGACVLLAIPTQASTLTGNELYKICNSPPQSSAHLSCISYIRGFMDGMSAGDYMAGSGATYCPPADVSVTQAELFIEKFMRDHPEDLDLNAGVVAALALYMAFPCKSD